MRVFRALLHLYPSSFQTEYGEELASVFAERRRDVSGSPAVLVFWLREALGVLRGAARAHGDILGQDLRHTTRTLLRAPGFAVTAVLVTALGIGANTAVFSVTDHVLIRPLPYADAHRLVRLWERTPSYALMELSPPNYLDWRRLSTSFEAMGAYFYGNALNLTGQGDPRRLSATSITASLFPILGIQPLQGRLFAPEDEREDAPGTALLSYGLWQGVFGGDPGVVGRTIRLDDEAHTVVGIMPPDFHFPNRNTQMWVPLPLAPTDDRDDNFIDVVARLKANVSLEQARAEMEVVARQLEKEYPKENAQTGATVQRLRDQVPSQTRLLLAALLGASLCVLLIACTNLASLLLARAVARQKELTVRAALGAGRERLVRQMLTEALVLAALGGLAGMLMAGAAVRLLAPLVPTTLPIADASVLDLRIMAFAALLVVVTGVAFGVAPALRVSRGGDLSGLRERSGTPLGGRKQRLRSALVMAEVTACVVLLVSSGLLIRALWRVQATDPGFRAEGVLTVQTPLPLARYATTARRAELYSRVLTDVRALPGVTEAGYISHLPMVMRGGIWPVQVAGQPADAEGLQRSTALRYVTPGFFGALGVPLRRGRDVAESDAFEAPAVAVVSESFVRQHFPGQDPLGRRFTIAFAERTITGVVADVRTRGLEGQSEPQVYLPHRQVKDGWILGYVPKELVIRSSVDASALAPAVRQIVQRADPALPIAAVRTMREVLEDDTAPRRTQLHVLGAFAALALLLAGVGIHGLLSFAVSQRLPELGVRVALGARSADILRMVLREGLVLAGVGAVVGLVLALGAGRAMQALLFGVPPGDAGAFLAAAAVTVLMTVSGSLLPALRAVRVDPTVALRAE